MNKADIVNAISRIIGNSLHDAYESPKERDKVANDIYDTLFSQGIRFHRSPRLVASQRFPGDPLTHYDDSYFDVK